MKTNVRTITCTCGNKVAPGTGIWNGERFICPACNTLTIPEMTKTDEEKLADAIFEADKTREDTDASRDGAIVIFHTFSTRLEVVAAGTDYKTAKAGSERAAIEGIREYGLSPTEAKLFFSKKIENNKWAFTWTVKGTM